MSSNSDRQNRRGMEEANGEGALVLYVEGAQNRAKDAWPTDCHIAWSEQDMGQGWTWASLAPDAMAVSRRSVGGSSRTRTNSVPLLPRLSRNRPSGDRYVMSSQPCPATSHHWGAVSGQADPQPHSGSHAHVHLIRHIGEDSPTSLRDVSRT